MKTMRLQLGLAVGALFALALANGQAAAQDYPSTIRVPVTFYDFRSDRSNPEFEQPHGKGSNQGLWTGMVATTLDADGKPRMGNSPYLNHGVRFWFRDNNRLSTYAAARDSVTVAGVRRGYLQKFRPIYRYGDRYPPALRVRNGNEAGRSGIDEWGANPTTGAAQVPYAYGNSTFATSYTGDERITATATGFTMNNNHYSIDSAYQNIVIPDTLIFNHSGNGVYSFVREGSNQFYPLNGKGFNNQTVGGSYQNWIYDSSNGQNRNYSYTMELVWDFRYEPSPNNPARNDFNFLGDDDVWVFVGRKGDPTGSRLVMDLGGIHEPKGDKFNLDQLVNNGTLNFPANTPLTMYVFYSERHANDANIRITTGIITSPPTELELRVTGEELIAGQPKPATGVVYDVDGKAVTDFSKGAFTWTATEVVQNNSGTWVPSNPSYNRPGTAQVNANGTQPTTGDIRIWSQDNKTISQSDNINLVANKAYTYIELSGQYCEGSCVSAKIVLQVKPGPASKLFIEASSDSLTSLRDSNPIYPRGYINLSTDETYTESFYAILRDAFGNWVRRALNTNNSNAWVSARPTIATATNGALGATRGQGRADRVANVADTSRVTLTHTASNLFTAAGTSTPSLTATSVIRLREVQYTGIKVGVKVSGTFVEKDSLFMYLPGDTTIWVQQQNSATRGWEEVPATWRAVVVSGPVPGAIPSGTSYTHSPTSPGVIMFIATTMNGSFSDTIRIRADYNKPVSMRFFNTDATPTGLGDTLKSYPPADTKQYIYPVTSVRDNNVSVKAGVSMPIYAATFGTNPPALTSYIPPTSLPATGTFVWSIVDNPDPNAAKITPTTLGYAAEFRSTRAHEIYTVRGGFANGGDTVWQELNIRVIPGDIAAVYIEPESQDLTRSSLNKPVTFTGNPIPASVLDADGVIDVSKWTFDTLYLANSETSRQVYALLRDKWGNYIAPSGGANPYWGGSYLQNATTWASGNDAVVTAVAGSNPSMGQGVVILGEEKLGATRISARDESFVIPAGGNPAWLPVKILQYSYTELRVREKGKPPYGPNDTLRTDTNEEPTLVVEGRRSDCDERIADGTFTSEDGCWEEVTGTWGRDEDLANSLQPPPPGSSWKLDPRRKGSGNIVVSRQGVDENGNPTTIVVEVPTVIELGPPLSAELVIITPADQIKAGQPIQAEVRYYNRTGLMEEWEDKWSETTVDRAKFADNRGKGTDRMPEPSVTSEDGKNKKTLGYSGKDVGANARLFPDTTTGRDTVVFYLYNASDNANPHRIGYEETFTINGKTYAVSASATLTLLPGDPTRVVIVDGDGDDVGDKIEIDHGDNVILVTVGEDEYGNRTGQENSRWCVPKDAAIPQSNAKCEGEYPVIVYETGEAEKNGCGKLTATPSNTTIKGDELEICIKNVSLKPMYALTRDFHGCGYINAVEVFFAAKFQSEGTVPYDRARDGSKINLRLDEKTKFICNSITVKDSVVTLWLDETKTSELQTGWKLLLDIDGGLGLIENVKFSDRVVEDGAAPVIYSAKLYYDSKDVRTNDYIDVRFSETVKFIDGPFNDNIISSYAPGKLFQIWEKKDGGASKVRAKKLSKSAKAADVDNKSYELLSGKLDGIMGCTRVDDRTLRFTLENGYEVDLQKHHINILADKSRSESTRSEIRDILTPPNVPDTNNRRVLITLANEQNGRLLPVPNPASPHKTVVGNSDEAKNPATGQRVNSNEAHKYIGAYNNPNAIEHIRAGGGGAVFQVPVYIARDPNNPNALPDKIKCQVKVYDLAGNLVSSGSEGDVLNVPRSNWAIDGATYSKMDMFWSGYNSKGMKAAPGTYRIVVQISYPGSKDPKALSKKYTGTVGIGK
jgi:fibro-slime domain-containing protein